MDVSNEHGQIGVVDAVNRAKPRLKEMAAAAVSAIKGRRIAGEQPLHDGRQANGPDLYR